MQLSGWAQAASSSGEFLWKQTLLVSVVMHAALLWMVTLWGHTRSEDRLLQPQIIEVEVVERAVSATPDPPPVKSSPVVPITAVHRPTPVIQPQPVAKTVTRAERQPSDQLPSQAPSPPQPRQKFRTSPKWQTPGQQPPQASSHVEPVQTASSQRVAEVAGLGKIQKGQKTMAAEATAEVRPRLTREQTLEIRAAYQKQLKDLIERHKQYPLLARKGRQQGQVVIEFDINRTGKPGAVKVVRSSGHSLLDRAALKAVRAVDRFPEPPATLQQSSRYQIAISFILE